MRWNLAPSDCLHLLRRRGSRSRPGDLVGLARPPSPARHSLVALDRALDRDLLGFRSECWTSSVRLLVVQNLSSSNPQQRVVELAAWLLAVWVLGVGAVFVARMRRDNRAIQARRAALVAAAAARAPLPPQRRLTRIEAFGQLVFVLLCRRRQGRGMEWNAEGAAEDWP